MRLNTRAQRKPGGEENLVPLINIVFLILIFFLVASTIRPFTDREITLATSHETTGSGALQRAVLLHTNGILVVSGREVPPEALVGIFTGWLAKPDRAVTIVADHEADARRVVEIVTTASGIGLTSVKLLTKRARASAAVAR